MTDDTFYFYAIIVSTTDFEIDRMQHVKITYYPNVNSQMDTTIYARFSMKPSCGYYTTKPSAQ